VKRWRELLGVAWSGLTSRKIRTVLIMLGPIVGVAAMVGAVGLTESAKGDLKEKLAALGTNLITVEAGGSFGEQDPTMPRDAVHRVKNLQSVTKASAVGEVRGVLTTPHAGAEKYYEAFPVPVLAADELLPDALEVRMQSGRWLQDSDRLLHNRAAVIGRGLANEYGLIGGEVRTLNLGGKDYGVVGVLGPVELDPSLDNAVFITQWAAKHDFDTEGKPTKLYVRSLEGTTEATSDAIPTSIHLGGPDQVSTKIPSDALAASAQADETLQQTAVFAGILALLVGGIGIANVMSISVIQRSTEIGIRRALGHTRSTIAIQFLLEALFVGILGGIVGVLLGVLVVNIVSALADWVVVIDWGRMPLWVGLAVGVSVVAGLYPSGKAARLEPLETLRLG
jgi:putative ABC transport system permease protein